MHFQIINEIFDYTQNLGSNEDVTTALLASAFSNSQKFMNDLLSKLNIPVLSDKPEYDYCVDTGFIINSNTYGWIKKKNRKINFKPDIMLSLASEWNDEKPDKEKIILIESKLWAKLGNGQAESYHKFKNLCKELNIEAYTIFLSFDEIDKKSYKKYFDFSLTWNELLKMADHCILDHESLVEQSFLEEIIGLMKLRLRPEKDDFYEKNKICCQLLLKNIKNRISASKCSFPNKDKKIIDCYEDIEIEKTLKNLFNRYEINPNRNMSYFSINKNNIKIDINCASIDDDTIIIWNEIYNNSDDNDNDDEMKVDPTVISKIEFKDSNWEYSWYKTLYGVSKAINDLN
jgi:hypothetical protein